MLRLSNDDCRTLLTRARHAILKTVVHQRIPDFEEPAGPLADPSGAFVTIYVRGRLRGCVGRTDRNSPLAETVVQCAINAALHDPRFAPLAESDVHELEIELSILSELQPISRRAIEIGRHGLLVRAGERRALLLPQVAVERQWSVERFLEEVCRKAGLALRAWRDPQAQLFGFTVEAFSEADFRVGYSSST